MKKQKRTVEDVVFEIVSGQMGVDRDVLSRETHFYNDLGADSLDAVELLMEFEDAFELSIPDEEAEKGIHHTLGGSIDYIERITGSKECLWEPFDNYVPPKPPTADQTDFNVDGDVSQDLLPQIATMERSGVMHLAVYSKQTGNKVYHVIHHYDDERLEIVEREDLLITGGSLAQLVDKAKKALTNAS